MNYFMEKKKGYTITIIGNKLMLNKNWKKLTGYLDLLTAMNIKIMENVKYMWNI